MRLFPCLLLAACPSPLDLPTTEPLQWEDGGSFSFEAALRGPVSGHAAGIDSLVLGLAGRTALFRPGELEAEVSIEALPSVAEIVLATARTGSGPVALVQTPTDVRLVVFDGGGFKAPWPVLDVLHGDLVGESPVVLHRLDDACVVRWVEDEVAVSLGRDCSDASSLTAVDADTVVVAVGDGVYRVSAAGPVQIAAGGQWPDWDGTGRLFVASVDAPGVVVMDLDGVVERVIDADAPLLALTALGDRGVVWAEDGPSQSRIRWASGEGEDRGELVQSERIQALSASADGVRLGVQRGGDVGSYAVE